MKKRKLLLLTAAVLCLLMALTACGKEDSSGNGILDYFAPVVESDTILEAVDDIKGKVIGYDAEHNLVAIEKSGDNSSSNYLSVYIYDFSDGLTDDYLGSFGYYKPDGNTVTEVTFDYPLFRVKTTETTYNSDNEPKTEVDYGYYRLNGYGIESVVTGVDEEDNYKVDFDVKQINGLYVCELNGKVYWINSDLKILRTFSKDITDGYRLPEFYAEYKGYLYTHEFDMVSRRVQVFNKEGVCQVMYTHPNNAGVANVFLLNDGNLFIEEWLLVEDGGAFDILYPFADETGEGIVYKKIEIASKILNFKTGEVTELDLDFSVTALESAYSRENGEADSSFQFALAEERNNQAMICRFSNGSMAAIPAYVVLDNEMNIEYTFKNEMTDGQYFVQLYPSGYYAVGVPTAGEMSFAIFDKYGNKLTDIGMLGDMELIGDYLLLSSGLYDLSMKKIYDFENSFIATNYSGRISERLSFADRLCIRVTDPLTDDDAYYVFDESKKDFFLVATGENERVDHIEDGLYYTVYDEEDKHYTLYSMDGTALLRTQDTMEITVLDGMLIVESTANGESVCYIVAETVKDEQEGGYEK